MISSFQPSTAREDQPEKLFTRRALVLGGLQGLGLTVLGGRLAWLQIVQGKHYETLADNNRINVKMLPPSRGQIVDRNGVPLALNGQNFRALIIPEQTGDLEGAILRLHNLVPLDPKTVDRLLEQSKKTAVFVPLEVKNNLTWEEVARIEVNLPDLPGLSIDTGDIREYPLGAAGAHLVGYVGAVSPAELEKGDPVLALPGFRIGKTGIERAYDQNLRGQAGTAEVEVNVAGREIRTLNKMSGRTGKTLRLTIDAPLQNAVQARLSQEKSASAVVMDAVTGGVYALCSAPSFDPNMFTRGLSAEEWEGLLADPGLPLNNKAVGGQYPPGSTFKMVTALSALEKGLITRYSSFTCPGHFELGGDRFHCWKRGGHGRTDLVKALSESCDVFFYEIAEELGIDTLAATARRLGLGSKLGFALKEERPGLMPTKNWKMGHFGESWRPGETVVATIGQGYIQSTPLQLAVMTARLVNGGRAVSPWIAGTGPSFKPESLGFKKAHLNLIRRGMENAVNHKKGTAFDSRIENKSMRMAGKTGTSQVRRITAEERAMGVTNEDRPWKHRHHALFVGYAPMDKPKYVCSVVVEHGGSGSAAAAPIAKDILEAVQGIG